MLNRRLTLVDALDSWTNASIIFTVSSSVVVLKPKTMSKGWPFRAPSWALAFTAADEMTNARMWRS